METLTEILAPLLDTNPKSPATAAAFLRLRPVALRRFLLLALNLFAAVLLALISHLPSPRPRRSSAPKIAAKPFAEPRTPGETSASRALSQVLAVVTGVPASSRKYELVRSLAERLLDENVRCAAADPALEELNRAALAAAFERTIARLEEAVCEAVSASGPGDGAGAMIVGAVRKWASWTVYGVGESSEKLSAEKLAAEALWLGQKMQDCGGLEVAVEIWGKASGLGQLALAAEPKLQVALVRVSVFLLKHVNSNQVKEPRDIHGGKPINSNQMEMLTSWLPLLCRAPNGMETPILSSSERTAMVRVLEEMIGKLSWEQQEEVLALWLHHFTSCPDSDWPNLESCYTRWYTESRKLFIQ